MRLIFLTVAASCIAGDMVDIARSKPSANGSSLPLTALVDQFYGDVASLGGRRWDTSSLIARLPRKKP